MQRNHVRLLGVMLSLSTAVASAADDRFTAGVGIDYSSGTYGGTIATNILYAPVYAKYETGRWLLKLTVPWLRITGPGNVVVAGETPIVVAPVPGLRTTVSGLGDVVASAGYNLIDSPAHGFIFDMTAKVKFPTADAAKGLGTGEYDYAIQGDAVKSIGRVSLFGTLGYRWLGSPPGLALNDVWYASVGFSTKFAKSLSGGLAYDFRQAATASSDPQKEVTAFLNSRLASNLRLQLYVVRGLTDSSPNWGCGAMLSRQF
jgi:hypothetical protein